MIIYGRGTPTLDVIFRVHGSALYKAFIPSMCSTGILLVMHYLLESPDPELDPWFSHPYPIAAMLGAFTFLLTFKGTFSYNRVCMISCFFLFAQGIPYFQLTFVTFSIMMLWIVKSTGRLALLSIKCSQNGLM